MTSILVDLDSETSRYARLQLIRRNYQRVRPKADQTPHRSCTTDQLPSHVYRVGHSPSISTRQRHSVPPSFDLCLILFLLLLALVLDYNGHSTLQDHSLLAALMYPNFHLINRSLQSSFPPFLAQITRFDRNDQERDDEDPGSYPDTELDSGV
jgi:hypothetical protein